MPGMVHYVGMYYGPFRLRWTLSLLLHMTSGRQSNILDANYTTSKHDIAHIHTHHLITSLATLALASSYCFCVLHTLASGKTVDGAVYTSSVGHFCFSWP